MAKLSKLFTERLKIALRPYGAVAEFCRKTGLSRNGVEKWLENGANPTLDNFEAACSAIGSEPWRLIMPDGEDVVPKSKFDALASEAASLRADVEAAKRLIGSGLAVQERELLTEFSALDEENRARFLAEIRHFRQVLTGGIGRVEAGQEELSRSIDPS